MTPEMWLPAETLGEHLSQGSFAATDISSYSYMHDGYLVVFFLFNVENLISYYY